ncbi:hypothetical protein KOW79_017184 [Hemibagrus wyckioides]|uniref:Uncharacterized protein n=1 Tax=Hemibagrus wyckioides TaxID=337641 RepID=A0A9D3NC69_9TELE|nr:hypothetical protein KOW79_017184 [Hemibagrus wyckioides]
MKMMKKMMLFVSFLLLLSHFSATFPTKGCVCEPAGNTINATRLLIIKNKDLKDLSVMEEPREVPVLSVVIPLVGASVFISLLLLSLSVINKQGSQVGGVLGSLIHYPPHSLENTMKQESLLRPETKTLI